MTELSYVDYLTRLAGFLTVGKLTVCACTVVLYMRSNQDLDSWSAVVNDEEASPIYISGYIGPKGWSAVVNGA